MLRAKLIALTAGAALLAAPSPTAHADPSHQCAQTQTDQWLTVAPGADSPVVRVPQPPNWSPAPEMAEQLSRMFDGDPEVLASVGFLVNRETPLAGDETMPLLITAVSVHLPAETPEEALAEWSKSSPAAGKNTTRTTVCGYPAIAYTGIGMPKPGQPTRAHASGVVVAGPGNDGPFRVVVSIQSYRPNDPALQHDTRTMLDGIQIETP